MWFCYPFNPVIRRTLNCRQLLSGLRLLFLWLSAMNCYTRQRLKCGALIVWVAGVLPAFSQTRQIVLLYDERTDLPGLAMLGV